ncbi:MAG: thiamine pyrophosphate-binding protein [Akkermansia sp.]
MRPPRRDSSRVARHLLECAPRRATSSAVLPDASARILDRAQRRGPVPGPHAGYAGLGNLPAGHRINDPAPSSRAFSRKRKRPSWLKKRPRRPKTRLIPVSASASFVKSLLAQSPWAASVNGWSAPARATWRLLQVLAAAENLVKWTHFDERSAAFFALGRIQDMGLPVAVVTTSGTAAAELLPAVVEAYYQRRPLLLLTADRPAACRGSAAPQAIEQVDLFGIYAPTIDQETPESLPEDILQDWDYASPLHINVCLPDPDPAWNPGICDLNPAEPPEENGFRGSLAELARALRFKSRDGLVVMLGGLDPTEQAPARGWPMN